jgi:prephenate dehydrogenase
MANPQITIIGLGLIGNSIGLGLSQEERNFAIVGHDKDPGAASTAKKLKAVDKADWNLINACEGADLVILSLPITGIRDTMQAIASYLKPGAVVLDTASIKVPVLAWARELLPADNPYIGTDPIVSGPPGGASARPDLFERATWAICPSPDTPEVAVKTATDLASRLGAQTLFLEPTEHDSMLAAVEHLPGLLSSAYVASVTGQPGWREMRQLAGGQFETFTEPAGRDAAALADLALNNREHLARLIDAYAEQLQGWKQLLAAGDEDALLDALQAASAQRETWETQRQSGQWEEPVGDMPDKRSIYGSFLGLGGRLGRRRGDQG